MRDEPGGDPATGVSGEPTLMDAAAAVQAMDRHANEMPSSTQKRPYHALSPAERRAAWAELRDDNRRRAKRGGRLPLLFISASLVCIAVGLWSVRTGHVRLGAGLLYASLVLVVFALIGFVKNLVQDLPAGGDIPPPPGL